MRGIVFGVLYGVYTMNSILRVSAFALCAIIFVGARAKAQEFGLPLDCAAAGIECRIQQYVDMDTGAAARDPYCSSATYEGHDGTDIRVLSMRDVAKGVPVIAMSDGKVLRGRDGEPDRLVRSDADRTSIANKECGNGLLVDHGTHQVQYCHLRQGSLAVNPGDTITKGQKLGEVGASGLAQFPHVHVTVRQNDAVVDPMTGTAPSPSPSCTISGDNANSLWSAAARDSLKAMAAPLLDAGIAGEVPQHETLSQDGAPPPAKLSDSATVGWAWFANLQKGDQVKLTLTAPDGSVYSENVSEQLDRNKADYSAFAGRKRPPTAGEWTLNIVLLRGGTSIYETKKTAVIK
jgi:hypothetical protein